MTDLPDYGPNNTPAWYLAQLIDVLAEPGVRLAKWEVNVEHEARYGGHGGKVSIEIALAKKEDVT